MKFNIILIRLFYRIYHHQQTLKEMKEVIHCIEVNQQEFVETINVCCLLLNLFSNIDYSNMFLVNTRYKSSKSTI